MPAVTELVISELLWLNYNNPEKQIYIYLNSIGTQTPDGQAVGFETEAYAILDTLGYIRPEVYTLVIGQAFGNAAMIAACGKKGCRYALEHARMMTAPPRMNRTFGSTHNIMIKANELEYNTQTCAQPHTNVNYCYCQHHSDESQSVANCWTGHWTICLTGHNHVLFQLLVQLLEWHSGN